MRRVVILRGLPGCGKSTWASQQDGAEICSADLYFCRNGKYEFNLSELEAAHVACFQKFMELCFRHDGLIVVDNTNTTAHEIAPYYMYAQAMSIEVSVLEFPCTVSDSVARNTHGVPQLAVERLFSNLEVKLPSWWKVERRP